MNVWAAMRLSEERPISNRYLEFLLHGTCSIQEICVLRNFKSMEIIDHKRHNFTPKVFLTLNEIFEKVVKEP
jgi:hypothetical protein